MSIALVVTGGYGNGTFTGTIKDVVLRGYGIGEVVVANQTTFGVYALIGSEGQGVVGEILTKGQGVVGSIIGTHGIYAKIDSNGQGVAGSLNDQGQGVDGKL